MDFKSVNKSFGIVHLYEFSIQGMFLVFPREKLCLEVKKMLIPELFSITTLQRNQMAQLSLNLKSRIL